MKITQLFLLCLVLTGTVSALTISGTAWTNAVDSGGGALSTNNSTFLLFDVDGDGLEIFNGSFLAGDNLTGGNGSILPGSGSFGTGGDMLVQWNASVTVFGSTVPGNGLSTFGPGVTEATSGEAFAIIVFDNIGDVTGAASYTIAVGDNYTVLTDPTWVIPGNNGSFGFSSSPSVANPFQQLNGSMIYSTVAVPEPGTNALLISAFLGLAYWRNRRKPVQAEETSAQN